MRLWALVCFLLFVGQGAALAETRSVSYSIWNITAEGDVNVRYSFPTDEAKTLAAGGGPVLTTKQVAEYVLGHMSVTRQGKVCAPVDQGEEVGLINTLALTPGYLRFEIVFGCDDDKGLTLTNTTFQDRVAEHVDYGRVQMENHGFVQHLFTADTPRFELPVSATMLQGESALRYVTLGFHHVLHSAEIICFMLVILLVARGWRDYAISFGGLVAGYGISTLLGVFAFVAPRFVAGPAFSGLLIFLTAVTALALNLPDPRRSATALGGGGLALAVLPALILHGIAAGLAVLGTIIMAVCTLFVPKRRDQCAILLAIATFMFALLDGFVLSSELAYLDLLPGQLVPMLLGFNLGTVLTAVVTPLCLIGAWFLVPFLRRMTVPNGLVPELAASVLIGCGVFWFASWLHG